MNQPLENPRSTLQLIHREIFFLQDPEMPLENYQRHAAAIHRAGGFFPATPTDPAMVKAFIHAFQDIEALSHYHWSDARAHLFGHAVAAQHPEMADDLLARFRLAIGLKPPTELGKLVKRTYPLVSLSADWNTMPHGRWRNACTRQAGDELAKEDRREENRQAVLQRMQNELAVHDAKAQQHDALTLHRIAKAQTIKDGPNAALWQERADAAARQAGLGSRAALDDKALQVRLHRQLEGQVSADQRRQQAAIHRYRRDANTAARQGDAERARYLRQQAADLNRISIDPTTGEHVMTHQPPTRPERGTHGGARVNAGGRRPGAGRKPLFAPAPPEPDADSTAHTDKDVSAARRWSAHAAYLAKHFTYVTATGELIGPSGRALDLRHPVSTPIGALRPGLLIAALLHGTVTRRYALPRGSEAASRWPLHTLAASVVDRERDDGPAQPGTPAHLLVPPAPRLCVLRP